MPSLSVASFIFNLMNLHKIWTYSALTVHMAQQILYGIDGLKAPKIHRAADAGYFDSCWFQDLTPITNSWQKLPPYRHVTMWQKNRKKEKETVLLWNALLKCASLCREWQFFFRQIRIKNNLQVCLDIACHIVRLYIKGFCFPYFLELHGIRGKRKKKKDRPYFISLFSNLRPFQ